MGWKDPEARRRYHRAFYNQPHQKAKRRAADLARLKRRRLAILQRDEFRCHYCGVVDMTGATLEVDHKRPKGLGGSEHPSNLVTACRDCNQRKGITPYLAFLFLMRGQDPGYLPEWDMEAT